MRRLPTLRSRPAAIRALHRPVGIALLLAAAGLTPGLARAAEPGGAAETAAASERVTVARDNLWTLARKVQHDPTLSRQQVMVAILRANPGAFEGGNMHRLRRGVTLTIPPMAAAAREDRTAAARLVEDHRAQIGSSENATGLVPATEAPPAAASAADQKPAPTAERTASAPGAAASADARAEPASGTGMNGRATAVAPPAPMAAAPASAMAPASSASTGSGNIDDLRGPAQGLPWLPIAAGLLLAGGLAAWIWRRPRREVVDPEAQPSTFLDADGIPRRRRPKVTEVSDAAAEMARTVEALQQTQLLVQRGDETAPAQAAHAMDAEAHASVQLELARALIAIGRPAAARIHLGSVLRQGSAAQKLDAQDLATQIG